MAALVTHPYDQLGLDAPFAEGEDEADRYEAGPAWTEVGESPYSEDSATAEASYENPESESIGGEGLAWLDVEAENDSEAAGEAQYLDEVEREDGESLEEYAEQEHLEPEGLESPAASPARPALKSSTVGGFGRYRSDAASLAPAERAKISALAAYVLWSFGPGRERVRSIELVGHADRDVARGAAFENQMSRERTLKNACRPCRGDRSKERSAFAFRSTLAAELEPRGLELRADGRTSASRGESAHGGGTRQKSPRRHCTPLCRCRAGAVSSVRSHRAGCRVHRLDVPHHAPLQQDRARGNQCDQLLPGGTDREPFVGGGESAKIEMHRLQLLWHAAHHLARLAATAVVHPQVL